LRFCGLGLSELLPDLPALLERVLEGLARLSIDGAREVGVCLREVPLLFVGDAEAIEADAEVRLGHRVLERGDASIDVPGEDLRPPQVPPGEVYRAVRGVRRQRGEDLDGFGVLLLVDEDLAQKVLGVRIRGGELHRPPGELLCVLEAAIRVGEAAEPVAETKVDDGREVGGPCVVTVQLDGAKGVGERDPKLPVVDRIEPEVELGNALVLRVRSPRRRRRVGRAAGQRQGRKAEREGKNQGARRSLQRQPREGVDLWSGASGRERFMKWFKALEGGRVSRCVSRCCLWKDSREIRGR
jgi:hypothetical protein